ncbi:hypothetical protein GIS00_15635 [Nakamurella sp. YIM 132087]|uniref:Oligosaccharide flippase family protein n=1 Tax=Nakamurella alba TaxID=2665158 RepID=A0A7K1FPT4_9ACTN|nr:hypothetical protein [Nakamurella alba]MTD15369.1 hypothetical protein [Nakamurella alba]
MSADETVAGPELGADPVAPGPRPGLLARLTGDRMFRSTLAIMATTVVTSGLGYVTWLLVARFSGTQVSGDGAAVTSLMMAAALLAAIGAATAMIEWLPRAVDARAWRLRVTAGLVATVGGALVGGVVAVGVAGYWLGAIPSLTTVTGGVLFVAGTVATALGSLFDYICISRERGGMMLLRNLIASVVRIPLVLVPITVEGHPLEILLAWTASAALSLLVCMPLFGGRATGHHLWPTRGGIRSELRLMFRSVVGQHLITVSAMLTTYLLPVLVVARLDATANAYFYVTWMLGSLFSIVSPAVSTSLFAAAAADPAGIPGAVRRSSRIIALLLAGPVLVYLLGGRLLLSMFGADYPDAGWTLLVLLTISALPDAVTNIAVAVLRAVGRFGAAIRLNAFMMIGCLIGSVVLLPVLGIAAVGWSWLGAQTLGAVWALATRSRWMRAA